MILIIKPALKTTKKFKLIRVDLSYNMGLFQEGKNIRDLHPTSINLSRTN